MTNIQSIVNEFLKDKPKKKVWGNYRIDVDKLVYDTITSVRSVYASSDPVETEKRKAELLSNNKGCVIQVRGDKIHAVKAERDIIAQKTSGGVLGNASILSLVGRTVAYGNVQNNTQETEIQRELQKRVLMVPFSVFEKAKLDLNKFKVIEKASEEYVKVKIGNPNYRSWDKSNKAKEFIVSKRHFTGACLFEVDGKVFLFDIDRREIKHHIFNAFLVEVDGKPKSIIEAYEMLKPKTVKDAEKRGLKVLRQGEWFLIPSKAPKLRKMTTLDKFALGFNEFSIRRIMPKSEIKRLDKLARKLREGLPLPLTLQAGPNRPNTAELGITQKGLTYVTGKIKHSGREHADLVLKGWYIAVPNTSIRSFTITGDID